MLSTYDLTEFNKLSKDSTIVAAYAILPQIRELILSFDKIDQDTYDKLYTISREFLLERLVKYRSNYDLFVLHRGRFTFDEYDQDAFLVEIEDGIREEANVINITNIDDDAHVIYPEFFEHLIGYFYAVNVGAFSPYLENKNDDGCDEARMIASWSGMNISPSNQWYKQVETARHFFKRWIIDWDEFREAMLYDEKKRKTFLKDLSKTIAMPRLSYVLSPTPTFENSQFIINDKIYLIFTLLGY